MGRSWNQKNFYARDLQILRNVKIKDLKKKKSISLRISRSMLSDLLIWKVLWIFWNLCTTESAPKKATKQAHIPIPSDINSWNPFARVLTRNASAATSCGNATAQAFKSQPRWLRSGTLSSFWRKRLEFSLVKTRTEKSSSSVPS